MEVHTNSRIRRMSYSVALAKEARVDQKRCITPTTRRNGHVPHIKFPSVFKEARMDPKRCITPTPQRNGHEHKNEIVSTTKTSNKLNNQKDSRWSKYFDHGGGRVNALNTKDELEVDLSKLYLGRKFAKGAHSQLYHGMYEDREVAVKITQYSNDDENEVIARLERQFSREVTFLSYLQHPNVIKLVAACKEPQVFCVITEYLSGGSLRAFLHKLDHKSLPSEMLIALALDIAQGMEYIHSQGVLHRDLKPENILFDENFKLKIVDFGSACGEASHDVLEEGQGTYRWMAPEMIKHKPYGRKVDVYSFGLILWEMLAGAIPYEDMTPVQAAFAVVNKNSRPSIPTKCPPVLRALVEQCWTLRPEKRPEFWQIVKILKEFESSLARDGTLNLSPNLACQDQKKGLFNWVQKHTHVEESESSLA